MSSAVPRSAQAILGESAPIRQLRADIVSVAGTDLTILIEGPTGVGKELVARAIHHGSPRTGPLVVLNVAAIPEPMFEDALFGHVRGAFTGAHTDAPGYIAEATGGTLFLDEISSLPLLLQPKLLRVLESRRYRAVGARADRNSDFRLISACNVSLERAVQTHEFRDDLRQRLAAVVLRVPALSARPEDIPQLARHFAAHYAERHQRQTQLSDAAVMALTRYAWPGNVRELRSVVEASIAFADHDTVSAHDVERRIAAQHGGGDDDAPPSIGREELLASLTHHHWDTSLAADELHVSRATVYRSMHHYGIALARKSNR